MSVYHENIPDTRILFIDPAVIFDVIAYVPSVKCCELDVIVFHDGVIELEKVIFCVVRFVVTDDVKANDAVAGVNVILVAALAVVVNELLIALFAQLPVPNTEPVIPRVTFKLPVILCEPVTIKEPVISNPSTNSIDPEKYDAVTA